MNSALAAKGRFLSKTGIFRSLFNRTRGCLLGKQRFATWVTHQRVLREKMNVKENIGDLR
jgi:hypothetical protein